MDLQLMPQTWGGMAAGASVRRPGGLALFGEPVWIHGRPTWLAVLPRVSTSELLPTWESLCGPSALAKSATAVEAVALRRWLVFPWLWAALLRCALSPQKSPRSPQVAGAHAFPCTALEDLNRRDKGLVGGTGMGRSL
jgi:hypothetical protein